MLDIPLSVVLWLMGWSIIGSTLGFFTIRNKPHWTEIERLMELIKSIVVGIFFAFPVYTILCEKEVFSSSANIMVAGSVAFIVTDGIINIWPKLIEGVGFLIRSIVEKFVGKL